MIIFLDTETTGFKYETDEVAQLSYIVASDNLHVIKAKNFYFTVKHMSDGAYKVNNLSITRLKYLSNGEVLADRAVEILKDICIPDAVICGHNVEFDLNMLKAGFAKSLHKFEWGKTFDTMKSHVDILKLPMKSTSPYNNGTSYKYPKLSETLDYYGITEEQVSKLAKQIFGGSTNGNLHDARFDATACYLIYSRYIVR